jgi:hypothetical protein
MPPRHEAATAATECFEEYFINVDVERPLTLTAALQEHERGRELAAGAPGRRDSHRSRTQLLSYQSRPKRCAMHNFRRREWQKNPGHHRRLC